MVGDQKAGPGGLGGHGRRNLTAGDLHHPAATGADQLVMVLGQAEHVGGPAGDRSDLLDNPELAEKLEGPENGRPTKSGPELVNGFGWGEGPAPDNKIKNPAAGPGQPVTPGLQPAPGRFQFRSHF